MSFEQFREKCEEFTSGWDISGMGVFVEKEGKYYAIFPGNCRFVYRSWFHGISMYQGKNLITSF